MYICLLSAFILHGCISFGAFYMNFSAFEVFCACSLINVLLNAGTFYV